MIRTIGLATSLLALTTSLCAQFPADQLLVVSAGDVGNSSVVGFDLSGPSVGSGAPLPEGAAVIDGGLNFGAVGAGDLAFGPDGRLYVAALFEGLVTIVDADGTTTTLGDGIKDFFPTCLAFGADGHLFVASSVGAAPLHEFDAEGNPVRVFGPGTLTVAGMAIGPDGHIFVSSFNGDVVKELDRNGKLVRNIGFAGQIEQPREVVLGPLGRLWVASETKSKIFVVDLASGLVVKGYTDASIDAPVGLAFGADGALYVGNRGTGDVAVFANPAAGAVLPPDLAHTGTLVADGLDGTLGLAFSPRRFTVKAKGTVAAPGAPAAKLKGTGVLSLDLGARTAMLRFDDDDLAQALGTSSLGLSGFWGAETDAAKTSLLHFSQVAAQPTTAGTAALRLTLGSKLDKASGRGLPKKASGELTRGGADGVVVLSLKAKPVKE